MSIASSFILPVYVSERTSHLAPGLSTWPNTRNLSCLKSIKKRASFFIASRQKMKGNELSRQPGKYVKEPGIERRARPAYRRAPRDRASRRSRCRALGRSPKEQRLHQKPDGCGRHAGT